LYEDEDGEWEEEGADGLHCGGRQEAYTVMIKDLIRAQASARERAEKEAIGVRASNRAKAANRVRSANRARTSSARPPAHGPHAIYGAAIYGHGHTAPPRIKRSTKSKRSRPASAAASRRRSSGPTLTTTELDSDLSAVYEAVAAITGR
jgi:hypothetical protein